MTYSYLLWLLVFVLLPLLAMWLYDPVAIRKHLIPVFISPIAALVFSIPWDLIAVRENIWFFREPYILGIWIFGLPLEEYCFITFVTLLFATATAIIYERLK